MTALVWVGVALASWLILGALNLAGCAWAIGRLKRRWHRREHYTVVTLWQPPVPGSLADPLPADASMEALEQAVYDGLFRAIPEVAADLRRAA